MVSGQLRTARRSHSRRGFTLIELMVVITIILIVSAVALPVV
jgi:prepilin-type N-terminal cleavage/methylation domain-containing protein